MGEVGANSRAGCLLCKPNKANGTKHRLEVGHTGLGRIRKEIAARADLAHAMGKRPTLRME
jgi:hypothetical protein